MPLLALVPRALVGMIDECLRERSGLAISMWSTMICQIYECLALMEAFAMLAFDGE